MYHNSRGIFGYNTPYLNTENEIGIRNIRIGKIVNVNNSLTNEDIQNENYRYGTVDIQWFEERDFVSRNVPIMLPACSKYGWGIFTMPDVDDIAVGYIRREGAPLLLGFIHQDSLAQAGLYNENTGEQILNNFYDVTPKTDDTNCYYPKKVLKSGEILAKSKEQSEIYLDRSGSIRLIARKGLNEENDRKIPDRIFEVFIGRKILAEDFKTEIKDENNNNLNLYIKQNSTGSIVTMNDKGDLNFNIANDIELKTNNSLLKIEKAGKITIQNKNNDKIIFDNGNITIENKNGDKIEMDGSLIKVGAGANKSVVLGEDLVSFLTTFINTKYNIHTHIDSQAGPTTPPVLPAVAPTNDILSDKVKVE